MNWNLFVQKLYLKIHNFVNWLTILKFKLNFSCLDIKMIQYCWIVLNRFFLCGYYNTTTNNERMLKMESKWVMCDKCIHNKNGVCGHGMMFIEKYPDQYHNCYLFSKPVTLMTKMKNVFKKGAYVVKNLIICLMVLRDTLQQIGSEEYIVT